MLTIITPSCRQKFLPDLFKSIDFDKIDRWIIVYDTSRNRTYDKIFNHPKILEVFCDDNGAAGHPQRNYGVSMINNGFIYFLDDDNIIHPEFWNIINSLDESYFYTFDQLRDKTGKILRGNNIAIGHIDTAMFIVPKKMFEGTPWVHNRYEADGIFIESVYSKNKDRHKYIDKVACYYNFLL